MFVRRQVKDYIGSLASQRFGPGTRLREVALQLDEFPIFTRWDSQASRIPGQGHDPTGDRLQSDKQSRSKVAAGSCHHNGLMAKTMKEVMVIGNLVRHCGP